MAKDITLFTSPTAKRVLDNLGSNGSSGGGKNPVLTPPTPLTTFQSNFAKVLNETAGKEGFYDMRFVVWDDTDADPVNHVWADVSPAINIEAKELSAATGIGADEVFRVELRASKEGPMWYFQQGGGGSAIVYIEITASTDINTYTGTIYDNPTTRTVIEAGVTVKAMQHDAGTIPNSASGGGFFCYKNDDDNYYITNYSVFYG